MKGAGYGNGVRKNIPKHDPVAEGNFRKKYPEGNIGKGRITYAESPEMALEGANICFIFTEWKEIREIPAQSYKQLMQIPLVYDGRNVYRVDEMKGAGVEYYSIGR